jgi:hypothetical protein
MNTASNQSAFFNVRILLGLVAFCVGVFSTLFAVPFGDKQAPTTTFETTLTFAERVAYQTAIEDVY